MDPVLKIRTSGHLIRYHVALSTTTKSKKKTLVDKFNLENV